MGSRSFHILVNFVPGVSPLQGQKVKNVGDTHLLDRGVTNWPVTMLCLVSHRWLVIGYAV